jgi:hypothetical protein
MNVEVNYDMAGLIKSLTRLAIMNDGFLSTNVHVMYDI